MEKDPTLHAGHRNRLRERFMRDPEAMAEHELLELLLFYAIPRRDTNDLAHSLIEEFGSLEGVLEAEPSLLYRVDGVKEGVAAYLKALCEVARRYAAQKLRYEEDDRVFDTPERIAAFVWPRFLGLSEERVFALLFDNGMRLLDCYHVCDGSVTSAPLSVRRIVQRAYVKGAAGVILAHNHPGGTSMPSGDDIRATRQLEEALNMMEIPLVEHYVFADRSFTPILSKSQDQEQGFVASSLVEVLREKLQKKQTEAQV